MLRNVRAVGYYQEVFQDVPFEVHSGLHAVSVVFSGEANDRETITLDGQSADWTYTQTLPAAFRVQPFPGESGFARSVQETSVNGFEGFAGRRS